MHPEIEKLIELVLVDGQISEKEKAVLFRKAKELGVDQDELEVILDGRIFSINNANQKPSVKLGDIKKCPACNAIVNSFSSVCDSCGYEFRNTGANKSVIDLSNKLDEIVVECERKSYKHMIGRGYGDEETARRDDIASKQKYVIKNFPVPNTRDDLMELLNYIQPKIEFGMRADKNVFDWRSKYKEIINRAKSSFHSDQNMLIELNSLQAELNNRNAFGYIVCLYSTSSAFFKWTLAMLGMMAGCLTIYIILKIFHIK